MTFSGPLLSPAAPLARATRRTFLVSLAALVPGLLAARASGASWLASVSGQDGHPDPRPGITGAKVLSGAELADSPDLVPLFDSIRQIPQIADGIRCHCGCARLEGYRSLLSCYEAPGMAKHCQICQGEGRLAFRRFQEGQGLEQIRRAIDARFGHGSGLPGAAAPEQDHC